MNRRDFLKGIAVSLVVGPKIAEPAKVVPVDLQPVVLSGGRYWVGGSGSWGDASNWAFKSGGKGGAPVPTPADAVIFDQNSSANIEGLEVRSVTVRSAEPTYPINVVLFGTALVHESITIASGCLSMRPSSQDCRFVFAPTQSQTMQPKSPQKPKYRYERKHPQQKTYTVSKVHHIRKDFNRRRM